MSFNPLPDMPILDSSKSAANRYDVKNMDKCGYNYLIDQKTLWEKREITGYEQFLLFPQCFQKLLLMRQNEYLLSKGLTLSQTCLGLYMYITGLLKTLWEKEKLLMMSNFSFSQYFLPFLENFLSLLLNLILSSAVSFSLEESKICHLGKI